MAETWRTYWHMELEAWRVKRLMRAFDRCTQRISSSRCDLAKAEAEQRRIREDLREATANLQHSLMIVNQWRVHQ